MIKNGIVGDWRADDREFLLSFHLPNAEVKSETLKVQNPFSSDGRVELDEESHTYMLDGIVVPLSVTSLIHRFARPFNPREAIASMRVETRQGYAEKGMDTDEEILLAWARTGEVQRKRGTLLHFQIEQYLNGCTIESPCSPEFEQFKQLLRDTTTDQTPFRTELSIYSRSLNVAGQIDALFKQADGTFVVWDWKRCKYLHYDGRSQMKEPFDHLPDVNYFHYALQLNVYRRILQEDYGIPVNSMFLGVLHPCRMRPLCVRVPDMEEEMQLLFDACCQEKSNGAVSVEVEGSR